MWCFSNDQLEGVLASIRERFIAEGHSAASIDFALRSTRAVLRSPEAIKLRVREHPVAPLPLFEVEEISVEEVSVGVDDVALTRVEPADGKERAA